MRNVPFSPLSRSVPGQRVGTSGTSPVLESSCFTRSGVRCSHSPLTVSSFEPRSYWPKPRPFPNPQPLPKKHTSCKHKHTQDDTLRMIRCDECEVGHTHTDKGNYTKSTHMLNRQYALCHPKVRPSQPSADTILSSLVSEHITPMHNTCKQYSNTITRLSITLL